MFSVEVARALLRGGWTVTTSQPAAMSADAQKVPEVVQPDAPDVRTSERTGPLVADGVLVRRVGALAGETRAAGVVADTALDVQRQLGR